MDENPRVTFVTADGKNVADLATDVDVVLLCNVLHQIPKVERAEVFRMRESTLVRGGRFGVNTLFYTGAVVEQTRWYYTRWLLEARQLLDDRGVRFEGRDRAAPVPAAFETLTPAEHRALLVDAGFGDVYLEELVFEWGIDDWRALSRYAVFVRGVLGDVEDIRLGSDALADAVPRAYAALGWSHVPPALAPYRRRCRLIRGAGPAPPVDPTRSPSSPAPAAPPDPADPTRVAPTPPTPPGLTSSPRAPRPDPARG